MVVGALVGLLVTAAVIGAAGSSRAHAAYRESLRELRDGDRRLEPGGTPRRLEDELRWYGDVSAATREAGWRASAVVVAGLVVLALVLGSWILASSPPTLTAVAVVVLLVAVVLVAALAVLDGRRSETALRSAARRSGLGNVRRLEDSLALVQRSTQAMRAAHRSWLRTRAATYPLAPALAALRRRTYQRSVAHRTRAVAALSRAVPVSLTGLSVRAPDGYAEGLRGLSSLAAGTALDDDTWAAAVADLSRAAERDVPRRTRWLSALAACAELRSDPPARESAARWALDAAALPPRSVGDPRTDPLPDAVALEPVRPGTWEHALHRARAHHAGPLLLAEVTLRWAYALVATPAAHTPAGSGPAGSGPTGSGPTGSGPAGSAPASRTPAGPAPAAPGPGRPGLATPPAAPIATSGSTAAGPGAGAERDQLAPAARSGAAAAQVVPPARDATDRVTAGMAAAPGGSTARPGRDPAPGPSPAVLAAAVLDPAVAVAAQIMTETSNPDEYLSRVRPGFESLGATSVQLSRLVPAWHAPAPPPTA